MNNKKKISIIAIIVGVILIGLSIYFIFTKEDKNSTLTLIEKQWIEANKNTYQLHCFYLPQSIAFQLMLMYYFYPL